MVFAGTAMFAQQLSVKSFRYLEKDLDARVNFPLKDQNGDICAIVKVVTTQKGFSFDGGMTGIVKTIEKPSEIWVYVPWGLKRLSIFHPQLGQLRDYILPISIEKACAYELVLVSGRIETTVVEEITTQWLLIKSNVPNSIFYINDEWKKNGSEYQAKLKPNQYAYKVEAPMYHAEAGMLEITDARKEMLVNLKPAFGYLQINSTPESGATVLINDKALQQTTPLKTKALASGEYTIQVLKDMFAPVRQKVSVTDGQTTVTNIQLNPVFAELTINAAPNATILMNGQDKGKTNWQGRLAAGVYSLEARLDKHRPAKQDIELVVGDNKTISLQPTPIYGSLDVMTEPSGASIIIDGKNYGTTPNTLNKILVGDYTVQLKMDGYAQVNKKINITEGSGDMLNEILVKSVATPSAATTTSLKGGITTSLIPAGTFTMGSPTNEVNRGKDETQHSVTLSAFRMSKYEITNAQYAAFLNAKSIGSNGIWSSAPAYPSQTLIYSNSSWGLIYSGNKWVPVAGYENHPVINVTWYGATEFATYVGGSLPTEAQWEYACRGGTTTPFHTGSCLSYMDANYNWSYPYNTCTNAVTTYPGKTQAVGSYAPNAYGLYDMHGNVLEWCSDWYDNYSTTAQTNPTGAATGSGRVFRGGDWYFSARNCRSAYRNYNTPDARSSDLGFRLVFVP